MTDALTDLTILVAEEDQATRAFLADNLTADGAHVETAQSCGEALKRTYSDSPDLIIADVNGDTLRLIEKVAGEVAIIVLSATDVEADRVRKLERGADDVVAKPFGYYELRARAVAVVRRFRAGGRRTLVADAIRVDVAGRRAWLRSEPIELSRLEFDLLCKLASDPAACSPRMSCWATCGPAPSCRDPPARWTATPAACAASCAPRATGTWRTCGASAIA